MSRLTTPIGPFSNLYVGLTGQATALTVVNSVRTGGGTVDENLPTEYIVALDAPIQSANHTCRVSLSFLGDADETTKLVRGLSPFATNINAPLGQTQYALFLLNAAGDGGYYLPKVRTEKSYSRRYSKSEPTTTSIVFIAENRDVTQTLIYKGDLATLQTAAGGQWPL
jgi:hypothetical protein